MKKKITIKDMEEMLHQHWHTIKSYDAALAALTAWSEFDKSRIKSASRLAGLELMAGMIAIELGRLFANLKTGLLKPAKKKAGHIPLAILKEWYEKDREGGFHTIKIMATWQRYVAWCESGNAEPDLADFHKTLKELSKQGKVELSHHSNLTEIPAEERKCLFERSPGIVIYRWALI